MTINNPENLPIDWEKELAEQAKIVAEMESVAAGGQFFSTRGGILSWNDVPLPGNAMVSIITDHILENDFYEGEYDPDNPSNPCCYAFGRETSQMFPHEKPVKAGSAQHENCVECPMAQWGTAEKGRGKACRNIRRLSLIPAGEIDPKTREVAAVFDNPLDFEKSGFGYLKLPVTSVRPFANFVTSLASGMQRPPHGVIVKISLENDPKTQFKVVFEAVELCSNAIMPVIMRRHEEAKALIEFPYPLDDADEIQAEKGKKGANKRPPVKKRKY